MPTKNLVDSGFNPEKTDDELIDELEASAGRLIASLESLKAAMCAQQVRKNGESGGFTITGQASPVKPGSTVH